MMDERVGGQCKGRCKGFAVKKVHGAGRYESGQGRCQTCDVWIDHKGAHLKDGSPATADSRGWYCNCCNFRIRRNPRKRKDKARMRKEEPEGISRLGDIDVLNSIISKALGIIKSAKQGTYMGDLKMQLGLYQDEMDGVAARLARIDGISRRDLVHQEELQDVLFTYSPRSGRDGGPAGKAGPTGSTAAPQDVQKLYNKLWDMYGASECSSSLYARYMEQVISFYPDVAIRYQKHVISFKVGGKGIVSVIMLKSRLNCDFMVNVSELDDPKNLLRDISGVGSWSNGKARLEITDDHTLQYGIVITRQCHIHVTKKDSSPGCTPQEGRVGEPAAPMPDMHGNAAGEKGNGSGKSQIDGLVRQVRNEHSGHKYLDKSLQKVLTMEFLNEGSVYAVAKNHPEMKKEEVKLYIRSPRRLPDSLKELNEEGLHPDPQISLQIALTAVNYHDWDGEASVEDAVLETAKRIADSMLRAKPQAKPHASTRASDRIKKTTGGESVSAAVAVWTATAALHKEFGINSAFTSREIAAKVREQGLCDVMLVTINAHISAHCVANVRSSGTKHRMLYRASKGMFRLYRKGDPHHPTRKDGIIVPAPFQIPAEYRELRRWYDEKYRNS